MKGELPKASALTANWKLFGLEGLESPDAMSAPGKKLPFMYRKKPPSLKVVLLMAGTARSRGAMAHNGSCSCRRMRRGTKCPWRQDVVRKPTPSISAPEQAAITVAGTRGRQPSTELHQTPHPETDSPSVH